MDSVEVFADVTGQWRWRRKAANGEIVATSGEGYVNLSHAIHMAETRNADCLPPVVMHD